MIQFYILFGIILLQCYLVFAGIGSSYNLTDFMAHRQKRSLIFQGGGIIKLAIGPILPISLGDPIAWRSILVFYNLQGGQYPIASSPLYPWDKWEDTFARSMAAEAGALPHTTNYQADDSRFFAYTALESYMNGQNVDGRACLLRAICENAQTDQHVGMLAELVNVLLTPGRENLDAAYKTAYEAGKAQADCLNLFSKCPVGASLLDKYMDEI